MFSATPPSLQYLLLCQSVSLISCRFGSYVASILDARFDYWRYIDILNSDSDCTASTNEDDVIKEIKTMGSVS